MSCIGCTFGWVNFVLETDRQINIGKTKLSRMQNETSAHLILCVLQQPEMQQNIRSLNQTGSPYGMMSIGTDSSDELNFVD